MCNTIGEERNEVEPSDIEINMPDILDPEVLPTSGIIVKEHKNISDRNTFTIDYLNAKYNVRLH